MVKLSFALNRYYRQIHRALPCSFAQKQGILRCIRQAVDCYREENPDATIKDIRLHFGAPEEIAAACVEESNAEILLTSFRNQRRSFIQTIRIAATVIAAALVFILAAGRKTDTNH